MHDPNFVELPQAEDLGAPTVVDVPRPRTGSQYDPEPAREHTRGRLAVSSFVLLVVTIGVILVVVASGYRTWDQMQGVAASLLPAVLSVVSSTLGFYFGARAREEHW
jgi:hypothetical protein